MITGRIPAALLAFGILTTCGWAKTSPRPQGARGERMTCEELVQLRDDRSRWERISGFRASTDLGWTFRVKGIGVIDAANKVIQKREGERSIESEVETLYNIGAVILAMNVVHTGIDPNPIRYSWRWIFSKSITSDGKSGRCSKEFYSEAKPSEEISIGFRLTDPEDLSLRYTLIIYDERKNILSTSEFNVRPKRVRDQIPQGATPVAPAIQPLLSENPAPDAAEISAEALIVAYKSAALLERCDELNATTVSSSVNKAKISKIEATASVMKIDLGAAKSAAMNEAKSGLDMFDTFAALGPMNYQQRSTLQQFCSVNAMTLLDASKYFADLDQAAGR